MNDGHPLPCSEHILVHGNYNVIESYICNQNAPTIALRGLRLIAKSKRSDLVVLHCPIPRFRRLTFEEELIPCGPVYHVEILEVDVPTILRSRLLPGSRFGPLPHPEGLSDARFPSSPVLNLRGHCVGIYLG